MSTVPYIRMTRVILSERNNVWYMQLVLLQNPLLLIIYVAESVSVCNFIHVGHTLFMNAFAILQLPRWDSVGVHLSDYSSDVCSWRGLYLGLRDLKYCEWTWANYIKNTRGNVASNRSVMTWEEDVKCHWRKHRKSPFISQTAISLFLPYHQSSPEPFAAVYCAYITRPSALVAASSHNNNKVVAE